MCAVTPTASAQPLPPLPRPPDFRGVVQLPVADWAPRLALTSAGPGASAGGGDLRIAGLIANKFSLKARHQLAAGACTGRGLEIPADRDGGPSESAGAMTHHPKAGPGPLQWRGAGEAAHRARQGATS
jgi:hypothetical protein